MNMYIFLYAVVPLGLIISFIMVRKESKEAYLKKLEEETEIVD